MSDLRAEKSIKNGSKTFALAGSFFSREQWISACQIYHWCRYCDDVIDSGDKDVQFLKKETHNVLVEKKPTSLPAFRSLAEVVERHQIPKIYAEELLNGMEMDVYHDGFKSMNELELYCYRVASTVGLMMCYIMGISDHAALKHASDLGMAMQLTNISRDIKEDHAINRNYIPTCWKEGTKFDHVKGLLSRAENYYDSGIQGLKYLPFRSAFVIMLAAFFYREIGRKILRTGPTALNTRVVVTPYEKFFLIVEAFFLTLMMIPGRLIKRHRPIEIQTIWRPV